MFLLLYGEDEYSAREELARLRETGGFDFNQDTFTGEEADIDQIRVTADTLPFLSERRLVVVLGLPKPKRGASDEDDADEGEAAPDEASASPANGKGKKGKGGALSPRAFTLALAEYAAHTPETTTLVVVVPGKLEATSPLLKAAKAHGKAREFPKLNAAQAERWVMERVAGFDASITPDAARLLVERIGEELRPLRNELEKLAIAVGRGGQIDVAQVRALTPMTAPTSVFDLTDALARRDQRRALALLHELLADGVAPLAIVGLAAAQTRTLLQVKALSARGMSAFQIAQTAGLAPFAVEKALRLVGRFTTEQLEAAHRALLGVDVSLKSTAMPPALLLDLLTLRFGETDADPRA
ncbi:MAG: DNA polymerase III subunit delta [Chloroflexota bacterium]|nr:DNA polymerase III subunit delta [Chloroflexota bacterium]